MKLRNLFLFSLIGLIFLIPTDQQAFAASPTLIATVGNNAEASTTCLITVDATAGTDLIAVGFNSDQAVSSVTDEDGQTYTQRVAETTNFNSYWYTTPDPTTNAANTITVTVGGTGDITCFGLTLSGTSDTYGNTASFSSASGTGSTITYSTANDENIIVQTCGQDNNGSYTWDLDKIERSEQLNGGANKFGGAVATEVDATAGSNDATCTISKTGAFAHTVLEIRKTTSAQTNSESDAFSITDSVNAIWGRTNTESDAFSITDDAFRVLHITDSLSMYDDSPWLWYEYESNTADSSPYGNDGTLTGASDYTTGVKGNAFNFTGGSNYITPDGVDADTQFDFNIDTPFSISVWLKNSASSTQVIVGKSSFYADDGWTLRQRNTDVVWVIQNTIIGDVQTSIDNTDNKWHLISATYSGNSNQDGLNIYVDGILANTGTTEDWTGDPILNNIDLQVGIRGDKVTSTAYVGEMDELKIYRVERTAGEVYQEWFYNTPYSTDAESDSLSITDSVTTTVVIINSESDAFSITDSVTATASYTVPISDAFSITDSVSTIASYTNTESDAFSITDSVTTTVVIVNSESDAFSITDSVTTIVVIVNSESDAFSITDSVSTVASYTNTESDAFSITDSVTSTVVIINSESDAFSITDSITDSHGRTNTESDAFSITDSITTTVIALRNPSDAFSITDSMTPLCTGCGTELNTQSDAFSITDSVTTMVTYTNTESDAFSITDSVTTTVIGLRNISDAFSITDSITTTVVALRNPSDAFSITDSMTPLCTGCGDFTRSNSDAFSITDSVSTIASYTRSISDAFSITDSITSTSTIDIMVTEGVDVLDIYSLGLVITISGIEEVFVDDNDSVTILGIIDIEAIEEVDVLDLGSAGFSYNITATETVNVSDTELVELYFYEPVGKYIWFNINPASNSTLGGVYAETCDTGFYVKGITTDGTLICEALP